MCVEIINLFLLLYKETIYLPSILYYLYFMHGYHIAETYMYNCIICSCQIHTHAIYIHFVKQLNLLLRYIAIHHISVCTFLYACKLTIDHNMQLIVVFHYLIYMCVEYIVSVIVQRNVLLNILYIYLYSMAITQTDYY